MKLTWRDAVATILVAAIVVPYVGYLVRGEMPFLKDARGMAATALVLGLGACAAGASAVARAGVIGRIASALGVAALVLGTTAVITENEWALGGMVIAIVLLWLTATVRHVSHQGAPAEPTAR